MLVHTGKRFLYCSLSVLILNTTALAAAEEDIARCARIASVGDRILCLEDALREKSVGTTVEPVTKGPDSSDEAARRIDVAEDAATTEDGTASQLKKSPSASPADAATVAAAADAITAADKSAQEDEIGAQQVRARSATAEERADDLESATEQRVTNFRMVPYERLVVELENGQVWRQIKGDVQRIRVDLKRNQTVDITESQLGGYKLRLNEMRRTIRVERIK